MPKKDGEPTKAELAGTTAEEKLPVPDAEDRSAAKRKEFWDSVKEAEKDAPPEEGE